MLGGRLSFSKDTVSTRGGLSSCLRLVLSSRSAVEELWSLPHRPTPWGAFRSPGRPRRPADRYGITGSSRLPSHSGSAITRPPAARLIRAAVAAAQCSIKHAHFEQITGRPGVNPWSRPEKGEPNAQDQDQVGRQKALQDYRYRQGAVCPLGQAPRHDQADQEADPPAPRHEWPFQDRRREDQEILPAERLSAPFP